MRRFLLLLSATGLLAACTSSGPVTEPGESIYTPDVRKFVVESAGGGFLPPPPPDPACVPYAAVYTLTVAGHQLDWKFCEVTLSDTTTTYTPHMGSRTLADAEWSALQPKLAGLVVSDQRTCGEDKPELLVTVTNSAGDFAYHDDFYSCQGGSQLFVVSDGLDAALDALGELARK